MKYYAYLRVSTNEQDTENQLFGVKRYASFHGFKPLEIVRDTHSGKMEWEKRGIGLLLKSAKKGDIVLVSEVSRLARSTLQVLELMKEAAGRGVSIHIVKNNMVLDGSMSAKITVTILGLAAEIERDFISARTKEGLARRKAEGKKLGRPKGAKNKKPHKLDQHRGKIKEYLDKKIGKRAISRMYEVSAPALYRWLEKEGLIK